MINFDHNAAQRLATDIRNTHQAIDNALADIASLTYSVIDACRTSDAPPAHTQAAIEGMAIGLTKLVDARKGLPWPNATAIFRKSILDVLALAHCPRQPVYGS
jgi:hypothetical protein